MRNLRVNEMIKREVSDILHTVYRDDTADITIIEVCVTADLRQAHVYYSLLSSGDRSADVKRFFIRFNKAIRMELGRRVVLKYLPRLTFHEDDSIERGNRLIELMDQIASEPDEASADDD